MLINPGRICLQGEGTALQFAAGELQSYLGRIFGAEGGATAGPLPPASFHLGLFDDGAVGADLAARGYTREALGAAGSEAYVILVEKDRVCLYGARPRAVLYAVYDFLRDVCGCEYAISAAGVERVPVLRELELEEVRRLERPVFSVRGFGFHGPPGEVDPVLLAGMVDWLAKLRFNRIQVDVRTWNNVAGVLGPLLAERDLDLDLGIHSLNYFVPAEEHADKHPEWYASVANRFGRQLRFSNLDSVPVAAAGVLRLLERTPSLKVLGLWPLDGTGFDPAEIATGEMGDLVLRYVNAVAETIASVRPDLVIDHLAYIGYAKPPRRTRPHPQVLTSVCHYWDQIFTQPICDAWYGRGRGASDEAREKARRNFHPMRTHADCCQDLGGWVRLGPAVVFTYYVDHNLSGQMVFDLARVIRQDLGLYRELGVKGSVACYCLDADFPWFYRNLHALAVFQWNPDADWAARERGLLEAVFGPAAPAMAAFYASLEELHNQPLYAGCRLADVLRGLPAAYSLSGFNPDLLPAVLRQVEERLARVLRILDGAREAATGGFRSRVEEVRRNLVMQQAFARLGCHVLAAFGCRDLAAAGEGPEKAALEARAIGLHDDALRIFNEWVAEFERSAPDRANLAGKIKSYRVALEKDFREMRP